MCDSIAIIVTYYNEVKCREMEEMLSKLMKTARGKEKYEIDSIGKPSRTGRKGIYFL